MLSYSNRFVANTNKTTHKAVEKIDVLNRHVIKPLHMSRIVQSFAHGTARYYTGIGALSKDGENIIDTHARTVLRESVMSNNSLRNYFIHLDPRYGGLGLRTTHEISLSAQASNLLHWLNDDFSRDDTISSLSEANKRHRPSKQSRDTLVKLISNLNDMNISIVHRDFLHIEKWRILNPTTSSLTHQSFPKDCPFNKPGEFTVWTDGSRKNDGTCGGGIVWCSSD
ncbi:hypothetical protein AKO1_004028, partial [Acrasis kona]